VVEVARWLGEEHALERPPPALGLPQSVRDAIGRRLDALSPGANELLRTAAVLGRAFDVALLARVAGRRPEELLEALGEALAARVLVEPAGASRRYAFAHALVRQTLYQELRAPERVRLHRRAAQALEAASAAGEDAPLSEIAHHYFEAAAGGAAEQAVGAAARAAERAHRLLAYEESARLYEQALEALAIAAPEDAARRFELLAAAGAEHAAAGAREAARARYRSAAEIARSLGRADLLRARRSATAASARWACRPSPTRWRCSRRRGPPSATTSRCCARAALEAHGRRALRALDGRARPALGGGARPRARERDVTALRDALGARHWACLGPDRVAERVAVAEEMVSLGERLADPLMVFTGHEALFGVHLLRGNAGGADRSLAECVRLANALRYRFVLFQARFFEGARLACSGDLDGAARISPRRSRRGAGRCPSRR